jgi:hypothetical protein
MCFLLRRMPVITLRGTIKICVRSSYSSLLFRGVQVRCVILVALCFAACFALECLGTDPCSRSARYLLLSCGNAAVLPAVLANASFHVCSF